MTQQSSEKEVFFHVGLGKTATTYLQYQFFPKLRGIHYANLMHGVSGPRTEPGTLFR